MKTNLVNIIGLRGLYEKPHTRKPIQTIQFLKIPNIEAKLTFNYSCKLKFFSGNETNHETTWGAFFQKKNGKCTEY